MEKAVATGVRRRIRWGRVFIVFIVFIMILLFMTAFAGAAWFAYNNYMSPKSISTIAPVKDGEVLDKKINILLLGIDDGDNEAPGAPKRTDAMLVMSMNPNDNTINLLSIPRDTRISIPGHKGMDKINHAHAYGGPELAVRTVEKFIGVPIQYYIVIDWEAFIKVVDVLGGVDLYVEHNMDYDDPYQSLSIHLTKGYQHLDGKKAGEYVRFRHDELGDIGRVQRQQRFLKALMNEMFSVGTIFKLPALVSTINQYVATNMNTITLLKVASSAKNFKNESLHTELLPGNFGTIDGVSYWIPDKEKVKSLAEGMFGQVSRRDTKSQDVH